MGSSFATRQRLLNDASGIRRERDFYIPIQTENVAVKSHFDTNGLGKEILRLDNDAKGRADDIYWLQVKDGIAMCTLPLGPLFWMCDDNRNCCQVFPGGECFFGPREHLSPSASLSPPPSLTHSNDNNKNNRL